MNNLSISTLGNLNLEHLGWKYYNSIKKKAMEQEFSWSGLVLSLSIAFFIVIMSAFCLNLVYNSLIHGSNRMMNTRAYNLEAYETLPAGNVEIFQGLPLA